MITADNLIDAALRARFYIWEGSEKCVVYEAMPEEGPNVRKKLESFGTRDEADNFRDQYIAAYKAYLLTILEVKALHSSSESGVDASSKVGAKKPPFMSMTKSFTKPPKKPRKRRSGGTSTPTSPDTSTQEPLPLSGSEESNSLHSE